MAFGDLVSLRTTVYTEADGDGKGGAGMLPDLFSSGGKPGSLIGDATLRQLGVEEAELGIMVGDRRYWNDGYGQDAVRLLLDHLFERLRLKRVYLKTLEWNIRAQRSFAKNGFREYGSGDQGRYKFTLMEVRRSGWEAMRSETEVDRPLPD